MRPNNDRVRPNSRFSRLGMKLYPVDTILGNIAGVAQVDFPIRSKGGLIGEVLESGEVNSGSIGQVLSVDAKRPIENWTKGLVFMIWVLMIWVFMLWVFMLWVFMIFVEAISMEMRVDRC